MKRVVAIIGVLAAVLRLGLPTAAETVQTVDLSRFIGHSPVVAMDAVWLAPHGRQVLDGIPFQIDGSLLLRGNNSLQKQTPGWTNVNDIFVGRKFERLHLLAGSDTGGPDGIAVAKVRLQYADGTEAALELKYGEHLRSWLAPWHAEEDPLRSTNAQVVWVGQNSEAAQSDKFLRLYHVTLANLAPEKEVQTMALQSAGTQYGLLLLAASVGPAAAERLPDTVVPATSPFPDLRPRTGQPARGEGFLRDKDGRPIAGGLVRVMAAREFKKPDGQSSTEATGVGSGTETDPNGHFVLPSLPDNRLYRLLATAQGFDSKIYRGLDPKSDPVEIRLKPLAGADADAKYSVRVRVTGSDKKPLAFAVASPDGVGNGGGTRWGGPQGFPEQALTDTNGEAMFGRAEPFDRLQLKITAPGLAPKHLWVNVTNTTQIIEMGVGAILRGRVLQNEKPLAGVRVGVSGRDRNSEVYAGNFEARTGTNGEFAFEHLPPDTGWYFYGIMNSLKSYGALGVRGVQTAGDGQAKDLGDLKVVPGLHLAGMVKTRDGKPAPKDMKVSVGLKDAWDYQTVSVDKEGQFRFDGLAPGQIEVSLQNRNWRLAGANRSLDLWNPFRLTGELEQDKDDLWVIIEQGRMQFNYSPTFNGQLPPQDQPESRPISGGEPSGAPLITLGGKVVDDDTGQPVLRFQASPGYKPPGSNMRQPQKPLLDRMLNPDSRKTVPWNERIFWLMGSKESFSNGTFSVDFTPLSSQPVLEIEAAGYEPLQTDPANVTVTNLVLRLKKGVGPNGVILLPNGQPAMGASVLYAVAQEQCSLNGTSLVKFGQTNGVAVTAADGKFSFAPRPNGMTLFVSHSAGWAIKSVERGGVENLKIYLEPWCVVTGTLLGSNNVPAAGVALKLTMFRDWQRGGALVNLQSEATTDASGKFTFATVPPGRLELQRLVPLTIPGGGRSGGMSYQMQTPVTARPGIVNDIGKVIMDHPPAESVVDALKSKLGL